MTVITRAHCLPFVGQRVVVRTRDGATHDGILHSVTNDGIYMRPIAGRRIGPVSGGGDSPAVDVLQNMPQSADDLKEVFFPFLFLPFFAIGAIGAGGWWW
ncbi:MAG: hypothetical protein K6T83_07435 [Alicyclobacillus sp.]|nr:hypothetical protein [Alicyclobacillus sp.]